MRRALFLPLGTVLIPALAACGGATGEKTVRRLAGSAGDRAGSVIPFTHDFPYARTVVDYDRGKTGDPQGPGTGEPKELFAAATITLDWDQIRGGDTR